MVSLDPSKHLSLWLILFGLLLTGLPISSFAASNGDDVRCERFSTIYHIGDDGQRHAYPNENIYFSHNANFDHVKVVSCDELSNVPLGKNVTYAPGVRLVKAQSVPTVYAITSGGILHAIKDEDQARALFGLVWSHYIDDLPEAFLSQYTKGDDYPDDRFLEGTLFEEGGRIYRTNALGELVQIEDLIPAWKQVHLRQFTLSLDRARQRFGTLPTTILRAQRDTDDTDLQESLLKKYLSKEATSRFVNLREATTAEREADRRLAQQDRRTTSGSTGERSSSTSRPTLGTTPRTSTPTLGTGDSETARKRTELEQEEKDLAEKRALLEAEQLAEKELAEKLATIEAEEKELAEKLAAIEAEEAAEKARIQAEEDAAEKAEQLAREEAEAKARAETEALAAEKARIQAEEDAAEKARAQALADAEEKAAAIGATVRVDGDTILYICPKSDVLVKELDQCSSPTP